MKANGSYQPTKWEEKDVALLSGNRKITKASVEFSFSGQVDGKALVEYLMYYGLFDKTDPHKGHASYVGLIRFDGKLNGKPGTFVMEDKGVFEAGAAHSELIILKGSGTHELKGITGKGRYAASADGAAIDIDYALNA